MTLAKAADILENPEKYWSHEVDDARRTARKFLILFVKFSNETKTQGWKEFVEKTELIKDEADFPEASAEAISGISPV